MRNRSLKVWGLSSVKVARYWTIDWACLYGVNKSLWILWFLSIAVVASLANCCMLVLYLSLHSTWRVKSHALTDNALIRNMLATAEISFQQYCHLYGTAQLVMFVVHWRSKHCQTNIIPFSRKKSEKAEKARWTVGLFQRSRIPSIFWHTCFYVNTCIKCTFDCS